MSDSTLPPFDEESPTTPNLPIPAGRAEETIAEAFALLATAVQRAEAVAHACARALDSSAPGGAR